MKRFILFVLLAVVMTGMVMNLSEAQVKVTFTVNTSTIKDTVTATSKVFMSGDFKAPLPGWGDGIQLSNIGGDYWSVQVTMNAGDTVKNGYKFRANGGWEDNLSHSSNNRYLIVGAKDTVLPVVFYNATGVTQDPNWKPYVPTGADSLSVWVRVNMKNVMDSLKYGWTSKDVDSVTIMGDNRGASGDFSWGPYSTKYLKREGTSPFYSGQIRFAKSAVAPGDVVEYKFRLGNVWGRDELQGGKPNRSFKITLGKTDTTLAFVYFNNEKPYYPGPVKVTFIVNTAAVSDTITGATSTLTVTGGVGDLTNWGAGVPMTNIGGDYWSVTITTLPQTIPGFKYRLNGGWEDNFNFLPGHGNDRTAIIGTKDTTLPVVFYNATGSAKAEDWTPYLKTGADSLTVWVRVNMRSVIEAGSAGKFGWKPADKDSVTIMGDNRGASGDFSWGPASTQYLKQESNPNFFSGRIRFAKSKVATGDVVEHKFRLGNIWGRDELQGKANRSFKITIGKTDTTLAWKWFDDSAPIIRVNTDTAIVTFRVNMKNAIDKKGFSQGDTIVVQSGFFKTGTVDGQEKQLKLLIGSLYSVTDTLISKIGQALDYQYYLVKNNVRVREYYFNFDYTGQSASEQERRQVNVASKQFTVFDTTLATTVARRQPLFPSQVPLKQAVTVKWIVDLRPAYAQIKIKGSILKDGQGTTDILSNNIDSIKVWGVGINGPATNLPTVYPVGDWAPWNAANMTVDTCKRRMWDNGTKGGDVTSGDTMYTVTYTYPAGDVAGKISKYGIRGGDNETGFGLNHLDNIDDANPTFTVNVAWGSINPKFYSAWDYNKGQLATDVAQAVVVPTEFALQQNFPNPFNPSTTIKFALPIQSNVRLTVFNVIGQEVATLVNENMAAGHQSITFNASHLSSGVYFYRLVAGQFTSIKKMMLVK